jgi:gliding motility-associated-like protein
VTDDDNCTVIAVYNITQPDVLTDSTLTTDATCSTANGAATVFPYGGTTPYSYLWNNGATTQAITGLSAGLYTVTVTDANSCTVSSGVLVSNLGAPVISLDSIIDASCNGFSDGAIFINVTSGTPPLTFNWSSGQTTEDITGIGSGAYTVTVTDVNNCISLQTFNVIQPTALMDSMSVTDAHCGNNNGSAQIFPFGGTSPYSFLWSSGQTTQQINNALAGTYTVTVTDFNNCISDTTIIIADIPGPSLVLDSVQNVICNSDSTGGVFISVSAGISPYSYLWSDGAVTQDLIQVPAGIYTVTVTDPFSCSTSLSQNVSQPDSITAGFSTMSASCNTSNGSITTQVVTGGTPGYTYSWSNGATTANIDSLPAGIYTLTVTDNSNCQASFNVNVNNISAPVITVIDSSNVTCAGLNDGFIRVEVTGGTPPYNYSWTNTTQTGDLIFNLQGNVTYTLTITDSLGCITTRDVFITEPSPMSISGNIPLQNGSNHISCFGLNDGSIDLTVNGGVQPYTYQWSNFATTEDITGLSAGTYTVTVTDSNSCVNSQSFVLTQPLELISNAGPNNVICGTTSDTLNGNFPVSGTGYWVVVSGSATFADSTLANTVVTDLGFGTNVLQWVITDGICTSVSQTAITVNTNVQAIPGVNRDVCADSVLLNAVPPQFGSGVWSVVGSTATLEDSSKASTYAIGLNPGVNVFQWKVVNGTCSDSALIAITFLDPSECVEVLELPTGFTPNGDGKNDYLVVKGIDDFPDNTLLVYNRWGSKVFEKNNYRNDWSGENMDGEPLPAGTYFVIFKSRSADQVITSYIDLRR